MTSKYNLTKNEFFFSNANPGWEEGEREEREEKDYI